MGGFPQKIGTLTGDERLRLYLEAGGNKYITTQQIANLATGGTTGTTSGNTSVITDNSNGTYTHDDGTGNTELIDTRANSNPYDNTVVNILSGSTVQQAIDQLANSINVHNDGNILWVSSEGNNSTAEKGDMEKPYADPWTARDNAIDGDTIIVLDGQWTFGTSGSGADYESTLDGVNLFSGFTDGQTINYHFGHNVSLTKIGSDFSGGPQGLFSTTNAINARVTGNLIARWDSTALQNSTIVYTENNNANLYFEFAEIKYKTFGIAFYQANSLTVQVDYVEPYEGSVAFFSFRERSTTTGSTINVHVKEYFGNEADFSGLVSSRCCGSEVVLQNANIYFDFDNVYKQEAVVTSAQDLAYVFGLVHQSLLIDSNFTINCKNLQFYKTTGTIANPSDSYTTGNTQPAISVASCRLNRSHVKINVDNCISDFPCVQILGGNTNASTDEYSTINVTGNYICNDTYCITMDSISGQGNAATKYITLDGNFVSKAKNVISDDRTANELSPVKFKGTYVTLATGNTVAALRQSATFEGAKLIVADTTKEAIETDNGSNLDVIILESFSNTLITNSDITELASPITRDQSIIF